MAPRGEPVHAADDQFDESVPRKLRKPRQPKEPAKRWTKWARFPGQATFDLANDMSQLPFSKSPYKSPEVETVEIEGSPDSLPCSSCGVTTQTCSCDPLMKELNEMHEEARKASVTGTSPLISAPIYRPSYERYITQEQLVIEVKGIYAGLVMVEKKCVEIDRQQSSTTKKLSNEQWQALIALHRTLLHEHHDFFLASQHPSASPALRHLATKYAMPSRMWDHGINGFLNILRHQMPGTAEHMLAYLNFAYSMLEDLSTQVPSLASEWVECVKGLNVYCKELQRIIQGGSLLWQRCTSCLSDWTNDKPLPSPCPHFIEHHGQASALSNLDKSGPLSTPNGVYGGLEWYDSGLQEEVKDSSSFHSTNTSEGSHSNIPHGMPDDRMPRAPWGTTLSQIASLVIAGWLWIGQVSDIDFNIYVKVFCILAMSDLG